MAFRTSLKVRFGDIDQAGIVYYPRFLHYFHVALEEFFEHALKTDYPSLIREHRIGFPTVRLETDFKKPLWYGDEVQIEVSVVKIGTTSVSWRYRVFKNYGDDVLIEGANTTVCLNMDSFSKQPVPDWLRDKLARCLVK